MKNETDNGTSMIKEFIKNNSLKSEWINEAYTIFELPRFDVETFKSCRHFLTDGLDVTGYYIVKINHPSSGEVMHWIIENLSESWISNSKKYWYFKSKSDASMFKLRFYNEN